MTRKAKKRVPKPDRPTLSTRTSIELRAKLDAAAAASGRSIAQETEHQLERAFELSRLESALAALESALAAISRLEGTLAAMLKITEHQGEMVRRQTHNVQAIAELFRDQISEEPLGEERGEIMKAIEIIDGLPPDQQREVMAKLMLKRRQRD